MKEDRQLSALMESALIARAKGGPNADPPVSERKVPRASVLAQGCGRRVYYWLVGAPEDALDALGACAFQDGKDFEDGILNDFGAGLRADDGRAYLLRFQERADTAWFQGSADLVTYLPLRRLENGDVQMEPRAIVDAKSANPASFDITVKKGEVSESYVTQLSLYAHALGASECVVVYRQKGGTRKGNSQVYAVFRFPPDMGLVEKAKRLAIEAMDARDGHAPMPARIAGANAKAFPCSYCPFVSHCWGQP